MHEAVNTQIISINTKMLDDKSTFEKVLLANSPEEILNIASNYQAVTIDELFSMISEYNAFGYNKKLEYFLVEILKNTQRLMVKDYVCLGELVVEGELFKEYCLSKATEILNTRTKVHETINQ